MIKLKSFKQKFNNFLKSVQKHNISEFAAQCAYYIILSFIPFIILLLTLIQYVGIDKENLYFIIQTIIPENMNETILGVIQEVYSKSLGTISISLIFIIWSSGKGFYSLCKGLQVVYERKKKSTYIFLKTKSIVCTIVFSFLIIAALILMVFGKTLNNFIESKFNNINIFSFILKIPDIIVTIGLFGFLMLIYKFIPNKKNKFKEQIPGAIVASLGWIIISKIFSIYLNVFKGFSIMYGSLTTITLIMMWVYFCIYIILIGAEINHLVSKKNE
ncbi:MAG: YihY/virulence factor BrkB family protein [Candidatus Scatovivens sp.]